MGKGKGKIQLQRGREANHKRLLDTENEGSYACVGAGRYRESLYILLNFAVNLILF